MSSLALKKRSDNWSIMDNFSTVLSQEDFNGASRLAQMFDYTFDEGLTIRSKMKRVEHVIEEQRWLSLHD